MGRRRIVIVAAVLSLSTFSPRIHADAETPYQPLPVPLPQFADTHGLKIHRLALHISPTQVSIRFVIQNNEEREKRELAWFNFPKVNCGGTLDSRVLGDVVLLVNGEPPQGLASEERASYRNDGPDPSLHDKDLSATLHSLGLPLDCSRLGTGDTSQPIRKPLSDLFRQAHKANLARPGMDADWLVYWTFQKKIHWQQIFPAHSETTIVLEYRPLHGAKLTRDARETRWLKEQNGFLPQGGGLYLIDLFLGMASPFEEPPRYLEIEVRPSKDFPYFGSVFGKLPHHDEGVYKRVFDRLAIPREARFVFQSLPSGRVQKN